MPTYEYECTNCGQIIEIMQLITARPKRKPDEPCEGCGQRAPIRRLIGTGGAVLFKGSGFYETDYRSEAYKKAAKAEQEAKSGGDKKDSGSNKDQSTKSESKTESDSSAGKTKKTKQKPPSEETS